MTYLNFKVGGALLDLTQWVTDTFHQYAYQPELVYAFVVTLMILSSFGLPLPEEFVIITTSLLAYMASNPETYPPPNPQAQGVDILTLMIVMYISVFLSDLLVYHIGQRLGQNIIHQKWFSKLVKPQIFRKVKFWTQKYGAAAASFFRFIPGVRFPGHLACGALGIPLWKFIIFDGIAVTLSIPTQVYFISTYGEEILVFMGKMRNFLGIFFSLALGYLIWTIYKNINYIKDKKSRRKVIKKPY